MKNILSLVTASLFMATLVGATTTAQAAGKRGEMGVDLNLFSFHLKRSYSKGTKEFNEINPGLTYTYQAHKHSQIMAGFLKNSFNHSSKFLALNFTTRDFRMGALTLTPAFAVGAVDGYKDTPVKLKYKGIVPILMPNVTMKLKKFRFNVGILPSANTASFTFRTGIVF